MALRDFRLKINEALFARVLAESSINSISSAAFAELAIYRAIEQSEKGETFTRDDLAKARADFNTNVRPRDFTNDNRQSRLKRNCWAD